MINTTTQPNMTKTLQKTALLLFTGLLLSTLLTSCGKSKKDIEEMVTISMQDTFDNDPKFQKFHLKVDSVTVIRAEGNTYNGLVAVDYKGTLHNIPIEVTVGNDSLMWKTSQGAFLFLARDAFNSAF